jgi:hypothetical protein
VNEIARYTPVYGNTASGAIATFDTSLALPLQDCTIAINGTNLTGANIVRCGINLWDEEWEVGNIDETGQPVAANNRIRSKNFIPVAPNTTYRFPYDVNIQIFFYDYSKNYISTGNYSHVQPIQTTPENCFYIKFRTVTTYGITYNNDIFVNYPATDTAYHAYNANSTTTAISWNDLGTVSEGTLDVTTGKLTVVNGSMSAGDYQITPTPINQISGTNNVFTDTNGDTSLEYYTKRGEQTVRIAEGVSVDVINNKNIDTLNTTNKTLVGAVDEVNNRLKQTKTLIIDRETISTGSTHTITNYSNYDALFFKINTDDNNGIVFTIPKIMYGEPMPFSLYSRNAGDFDASSYYIRAHGSVKNGLVSITYVKVVGWAASSAKLNVWGINFGIGT